MVNAIADAIFGEATRRGHVQLRVITAADRIPLLQADEIDIVARNMTINCTRWQQIAFSAEYFRSGQKLLVREGDVAAIEVDRGHGRQARLRPGRDHQHREHPAARARGDPGDRPPTTPAAW